MELIKGGFFWEGTEVELLASEFSRCRCDINGVNVHMQNCTLVLV